MLMKPLRHLAPNQQQTSRSKRNPKLLRGSLHEEEDRGHLVSREVGAKQVSGLSLERFLRLRGW